MGHISQFHRNPTPRLDWRIAPWASRHARCLGPAVLPCSSCKSTETSRQRSGSQTVDVRKSGVSGDLATGTCCYFKPSKLKTWCRTQTHQWCQGVNLQQKFTPRRRVLQIKKVQTKPRCFSESHQPSPFPSFLQIDQRAHAMRAWHQMPKLRRKHWASCEGLRPAEKETMIDDVRFRCSFIFSMLRKQRPNKYSGHGGGWGSLYAYIILHTRSVWA